MDRKWISNAISEIDEVLIEEAMYPDSFRNGRSLERIDHMDMFTNQGMGACSRKLIGLILAACMVFALATTAYAADLGGIQRIVQIWLHGEQTDAVLNVQEGSYTLTDESGNGILSGGGIAIEPDGSERPVTEEEILAHLDQPELLYQEDGTIWIYYRDQKQEITDMFDEEDVCYLELKDGEHTLYVTVKKNDGMATSPKGYPQPNTFGTNNK